MWEGFWGGPPYPRHVRRVVRASVALPSLGDGVRPDPPRTMDRRRSSRATLSAMAPTMGEVRDNIPTFRAPMRRRSIRGSAGGAKQGAGLGGVGPYVPCPGSSPSPALVTAAGRGARRATAPRPRYRFLWQRRRPPGVRSRSRCADVARTALRPRVGGLTQGSWAPCPRRIARPGRRSLGDWVGGPVAIFGLPAAADAARDAKGARGIGARRSDHCYCFSVECESEPGAQHDSRTSSKASVAAAPHARSLLHEWRSGLPGAHRHRRTTRSVCDRHRHRGACLAAPGVSFWLTGPNTSRESAMASGAELDPMRVLDWRMSGEGHSRTRWRLSATRAEVLLVVPKRQRQRPDRLLRPPRRAGPTAGTRVASRNDTPTALRDALRRGLGAR